jgi:anti-sigma factor RsiW
MKCKNAVLVLPAYLDHCLSQGQEAEVREHLDLCPSCREEVRSLSDAWDILGVLEPIQLSPDFRARFWAKVRREENTGAGRDGIFARLPWAPALAGFLVLWMLGVAGGVRLFGSRRSAATSFNQALDGFVSSYPLGSIEKVFLEGRTPQENHGGNV